MRSISQMIGAALVGGVVGGLVVGFVLKPSAAEPTDGENGETSSAASAERPRPSEEFDDRRLRALAGRVSVLERKSAAAAELGKYARQMARSTDSGADSHDRLSPVVDAEDPVFGLAVRSVLDRVQWERDEERRVTRAQRRQLRVARQTDYLAERLNLTDAQRDAVTKIFETQSEKFQALRRPPDGGPPPLTRREWRTQTRSIRAETDAALGEVLDEQQMKDYEALQEEDEFETRGGAEEAEGGKSRAGVLHAVSAPMTDAQSTNQVSKGLLADGIAVGAARVRDTRNVQGAVVGHRPARGDP